MKQPDPRPVLASAPDAEPAPAEPPTPAEPALLAVAPPAVMQPEAAPAWPPPGDQGIIVQPHARVPAGSYLPPSAVLPSAEALVAGAIGRAADPNAHVIPARSEVGARGPAPADRLAQLGLPADSPRRVVGVGAVIASLGFLLPWAAVLAGSGLLGGYLTQWGLAGPGHWIVALLLVGLAVVALAGGRLASVPVGLPAVAIATLLTGLAWPYLFGFLGRAVGIWVVLFGAILMVSGGLLDLKATRHAEPDSSV